MDARVHNDTIINTSNFREGQLNWLYAHKEYGQFDLLNFRIETFTGYSVKYSESYQIVNYGLNGHYQPHHDVIYPLKVRIKIVIINS